MILRYGQTWGQGFPDIKPNAMLDIRDLLDYEVVKAYNTTIEDLEQVIEESVEYEEDGTSKRRFHALRDSQWKLNDMAAVQGHGDEVQTSKLLERRRKYERFHWNFRVNRRFVIQ